MAAVREIKYIGEILKKIDSISEIEKAEIIEVPEDVEADIGLKIKPKTPRDRYKILEEINNLEWEIYDKYGVLPTIYWEFDYK